jgi:hypothetical protein
VFADLGRVLAAGGARPDQATKITIFVAAMPAPKKSLGLAMSGSVAGSNFLGMAGAGERCPKALTRPRS